MIEYKPKKLGYPVMAAVPSLWGNMPTLLEDIIETFCVKTDLALEFGVFKGYSTSALAYYFKHVIGVDRFDWDEGDHYLSVMKSLINYRNITLVNRSFEKYIQEPIFDRYDLIHIDIGYKIHDYETTFPCGEWAVQHSDCVIFHDTGSFPEVYRACEDLANKYGKTFYNYPHDSGLGIIV